MLYSDPQQLIGGTPLVRLARLERQLGLAAHLYAKLESYNPAGSAKDRVALSMIDDAEARGLLQPGGTIIEPTSGNTGIGLAVIAALRGYRAIILMPDTMSPERIKLMTAYGAQVILTPGAEGMFGSIARAKELAAATPNSWIPDQFNNPANALAHDQTTGPEIWRDLSGQVDAFVAGIGTGGTITGTGRYLKKHDPGIYIAGVEPAASPLLSGGDAGPHGLQGIGANFIPSVLDRTILDRVIPVWEAEAYAAARTLAKTEGLLCGISSGAALHGAVTLARVDLFSGKNIVVLLPDSGDHYLSTDLF